MFTYIIFTQLISLTLSVKSFEGTFFDCFIDKKIDLSQDCQNLHLDKNECEVLINTLLQFSSGRNNEFQYFYVHQRGRIPFYTDDGMVFSLTCNSINRFFYDDICKKCTKDLPVHFNDIRGNYRAGFLSRLGFFKNTSERVDCDDAVDHVYSFGAYEIIRRGELIVKNDRIPRIETAKIFQARDEFDAKLQEIESNPVYAYVRDLLTYAAIFAVLVYTVYNRVTI
jgi:hypothetical protein